MKYLRQAIRLRNWTLVHAIKVEQIIIHISFLKLCKIDHLIPFGLRCPDLLKSTMPCPESEQLARRHSFQVMKLLIRKLYAKLTNLRNNGMRSPLTLHDSCTLQKARVCFLSIKAKKLSTLLLAAYGADRQINMNAFSNLSDAVFSPEEIELLSKGSAYAPQAGSVPKKQHRILDAKIVDAIRKLPSDGQTLTALLSYPEP